MAAEDTYALSADKAAEVEKVLKPAHAALVKIMAVNSQRCRPPMAGDIVGNGPILTAPAAHTHSYFLVYPE